MNRAERKAAALAAGIAAAHGDGPDHHEFVIETREQELRGDVLRSRGGCIPLNSGHALQRGRKRSEGVARSKE